MTANVELGAPISPAYFDIVRTMDRPSDIFRNAEWDRRRREEEEWDRWFTGEALSSQTTGVTDKDTGEPQKRNPLLINPIEVYAEIHRDVLFGMAQNYDEPPVRTVFQDGKSEDVNRRD